MNQLILFVLYVVGYVAIGVLVAVLTKKSFMVMDSKSGNYYDWERDRQVRCIPIGGMGIAWPVSVPLIPVWYALYLIIIAVAYSYAWLDKKICGDAPV